MMSLIDLDDEQRWVPTHVNVTVLRARGLRTKSKHGSRYLYAIVQVGKDKYTTGLVDKADVPEWNEDCCFELLPGVLEAEAAARSAFPPGSGELLLTVMHRVLIGLDVFLGQTVIPLDKVFQDGPCPRDEWFKLNSKVGRKPKDRGELQLTVQFTRNNMTASMFDLTMKDEPRSAFGKLKDRVTGKRRGDVESSSAIVPGRYAALSGSSGQPFGPEFGGDVGTSEEKRSKVKDFFTGRLRKASDTRSCSSLGSESSVSSISSDKFSPPPILMSDPPSSPIYSTKVRADPHYGDSDLAKKVLTSQHATKVLTHKRAFSDEVAQISTAPPRGPPALESIKGQLMTQSKSSLCINGSHVYESEPSAPKSSGALPSKLVLLEKCSPLSRSLQNLTKKSEVEGRQCSFDKTKKDEKEAESGCPDQVTSAAGSPEKGRKIRKTLFSSGRSESLPARSDPNQTGSTSEGRLRGWFGSGDPQNKPRLEVSPKVENSSGAPPPLPPRSALPPPSSTFGYVSPNASLTSTSISPCNPFHPNLQRNPFFDELIAEDLQKSPTFVPSSSGPSRFCHTPQEASPSKVSMKRERPRVVARQTSLPVSQIETPNFPRSLSESVDERDDDSFGALASSRLQSPEHPPHPKPMKTSPGTSRKRGHPSINAAAQKQLARKEELLPLPPRRLFKTSAKDMYSDGWLHRGQQLAVHKEAYLLSQSGVASRQRGREDEGKRSNFSSESEVGSESSESPNPNVTSPSEIPLRESLKRFKYEPLEDVSDFWGGMLFEQDLYGRVCSGNYRRSKVKDHRLSFNAEESVTSSDSTKLVETSEFSVSDLLKMSYTDSLKTDVKTIPINPEESQTSKARLPVTSCINNNNIPFSLTSGDLNMNVISSDFGFIDSDGSSQSEVVETLKSVFQQLSEDPQMKPCDEKQTYDDVNATTAPSINRCKRSAVGQTQEAFEEIPASMVESLKVGTLDVENAEINENDETNTTRSSPEVVSARLRPKGVSRQSSTDSPNSCRRSGDTEFIEFLSLVQNISDDFGEEPTPSDSTETPLLSSHLISSNDRRNATSQGGSKHITPAAFIEKVITFENLHVGVTPNSRSKVVQPLPPSIPPTLTLQVDTPFHCHDTRPSSSAASDIHSSTNDQALVDASHPLLPEETHPASNLPSQESCRSHPVKPLTSSPSERKESRSVLEKLKSSIHPGRGVHQTSAEPDKRQESSVDSSAHYQQLTNMELISLLLQQEMDLQKQQAASGRQEEKLQKCEAELKKVKAQLRDLEDYIDNLLLRIMEQTPTLLQVRARHK